MLSPALLSVSAGRRTAAERAAEALGRSSPHSDAGSLISSTDRFRRGPII